jgi:hypothetical protein
MEIPDQGIESTGYGGLIKHFALKLPPHHISSFIAEKGARKTIVTDGIRNEIYPNRYRPRQTSYSLLEFALKYEGINLCILQQLFKVVDVDEVRSGILETPGGKYARRIWFLYEYLTGEKLDVPDPPVTNYVPVLDPEKYYTAEGTRSKRHRVLNNLLGSPGFCPIVRKSQKLEELSSATLRDKVSETLHSYPDDLIRRATAYLYTKETKTSFEIENVVPGADRMARFVDLLRRAGREDFLTKQSLVDLQQAIVEGRFAEEDYRDEQNYVGQSVRLGNEIVHYVPPKPEDVNSLMDAFLETARRLTDSDLDPIIASAIVSFGFVFIHPFRDGNGRVHRFLIHHVLRRRNFTLPGLIFPVSATMLRERDKYDTILETVSKPVMELVEYDLDDEGRMVVLNETVDYYRYLDLTGVVEGLFDMIEGTIGVDLVEELDFLTCYDQAKSEVQLIVDLPDRLLDLFIRLVVQNRGQLSRRKRNSLFRMLEDDEVTLMERAVRDAFGAKTGASAM